ncbi:histone deacetylase 14-like isoform X2 [Helianthus annuus]|uniref:histone deacetylase 14-like isoform X2 n=1 Tax=Helianthus annuus TaxID=4232 RepID=UPI000B903B1A|nr:histone deacetylase 14-like isoform X2 [Helianthus annuus]
MRSRLFQKHSISLKKHSKVSISCSLNESTTKVIYSVAPAMGHNKEAHPECSLRVPAIVTALEKVELTPKFRGSEIIQLQDFRTATVEDIASVHSRSYVFGLEKAMEQASDQGFIHISRVLILLISFACFGYFIFMGLNKTCNLISNCN